MADAPTPTSRRRLIRFKRQDAPRLRKAADESLIFGHIERYPFLRDAANAAEKNEPLIIEADSDEEILRILADVARWCGLRIKSLDSASSQTPGG